MKSDINHDVEYLGHLFTIKRYEINFVKMKKNHDLSINNETFSHIMKVSLANLIFISFNETSKYLIKKTLTELKIHRAIPVHIC